MKFTVSREALKERLNSLSNVLSPQTTLPILQHLLVRLEGGKLEFTATDLVLSLVTILDVDMTSPGMAAIPGKKLSELVREFDGDIVSFEIENGRARIQCGGSDNTLLCGNVDDFPILPDVASKTDVTLDAEDFTRKVSKTLFAVSRDDTRPNLLGALLEISDGYVTMVSSDSHRLVKISSETGNPAEQMQVIIPSKTLSLLMRLLPLTTDPVNVRLGESYVAVKVGENNVHSKIIDAKFPNYRRVIPAQFENVITVNRERFMAVVRRSVVLSSSRTHQIKIEIVENFIKFSVQSPEFGMSKEDFPVEYSGEILSARYNGNYMLEILKNIEDENVTLSYSASGKAVVIKPVTQRDTEDILFLLMPLMQKKSSNKA